QKLVVSFGGPHAERRSSDGRWSGNNQAVFLGVVANGEVQTLPCTCGTAAVQIEHQSHLLTSFQVAGIFEEELAAAVGLHRVGLSGDVPTKGTTLSTCHGTPVDRRTARWP